jgi:glutathione synthase/RimK-type ligase-like ATP-grasp enzyme
VTILILSALEDVHAQAVMAALESQGGHAEVLNLSEFPTQLELSIAFNEGWRKFELRHRGGGALDPDAIDAIWWRRPQPFALPPGMSLDHQRFAQSESTSAFRGLYQALDAFWLNDPARDAVAGHKSFQLALAQRIGLEIPVTLITNSVEEAQAFWRAHEGEVIYKQFIGLPGSWRETRRLCRNDEMQAEAIAHAPVIFQRHVPATADIRVTAVGGVLFAAAADVRHGEYPQDVRMNLDVKYEAHDLPAEVTHKIAILMKTLGLVYGAIDLRLTPEGRYVFLEINPAGQFLYIEEATGQPIAATLARTLLQKPAGNGWTPTPARA